MSIQVKVFDEKLAEQELKKCPKIVQDYVKLLKEENLRKKDLINKCLTKIKSQDTPNKGAQPEGGGYADYDKIWA